ncbi:dienelactone hydrolase [Fusarium albosuccineum]|uniref:Dienelactone hydrolase n=1 Tax=Fusarium albosuccineum TaxID=1237068 RepID=A0A8H4P4C8_9HYPO|nr:dienelactone hydrolase [Fusarium albosuccineum]
MTSNAPDRCCTVGSIHEGNPEGKLIRINGKIGAYLATPVGGASPPPAVLYLADNIGIWRNSKLMADAFASHGYVCLVLDLFDGDPAPLNAPEDFDVPKWLTHGSSGKNPHTDNEIDPIVAAGIDYLRHMGIVNIASAGYCLGAKYAIRHFAAGIKCSFLAHPSFVGAEDLATVPGPVSIAAAEHDDIFTVDQRHASEKALASSGQDFQINLFSGVHHGFAVRGDLNDKKQLFAKEQAFRQAVSWFERYLKGNEKIAGTG